MTLPLVALIACEVRYLLLRDADASRVGGGNELVLQMPAKQLSMLWLADRLRRSMLPCGDG